MSRIAAAISILVLASAAVNAQAPQPESASAKPISAPWTVTVVHKIDLQEMVAHVRSQGNVRVGVAGTAPQTMYNLTTGLLVDGAGHVVTRLSSLDSLDNNHKLAVTTFDGYMIDAKLIGVDLATGFAVLEVAALKSALPKTVAAGSLSNGTEVRILSSNVVSRSGPDKFYLTPSITLSKGRILVDSIYARARGAMTLLSDGLLSRSDSSVVVTPDNEVVGMMQWAGYGRGYLFKIDFIRDTIAKRVIDKNGNVPAGWLGVVGYNVSQLSDSDAGALGLGGRKAGVIVREITPQSPAAVAGLKLHDVITKVDDIDVAGTAELKAALSSLPAGYEVKLRALRDQQPVVLKALLAPKPQAQQQLAPLAFDPMLENPAQQREQLQKRFEELKTQARAYQSSPVSRERDEALRELDFEIRKIYEAL